jgi:hypothetical protein
MNIMTFGATGAGSIGPTTRTPVKGRETIIEDFNRRRASAAMEHLGDVRKFSSGAAGLINPAPDARYDEVYADGMAWLDLADEPLVEGALAKFIAPADDGYEDITQYERNVHIVPLQAATGRWVGWVALGSVCAVVAVVVAIAGVVG